MKKVILAATMLFAVMSSQSYAALVTVIGSASVVQGSTGGFFNVPISISSNSGSVDLGAYLVDFSVFQRSDSLGVFSEGPNPLATLFNTAGLVGANSFDISSSFISNGTTAQLSLLSSTPTSIPVDAGGILAFLPVRTTLPLGSYSLRGSIIGIQSGAGLDIDGPVSFGTFTVTAVPEPSTVALLAVVGISGFAARRFRNARRKAIV